MVSFLGSKTKILQPLLYFYENIQRGDPWKNIFFVFFLMHYFTLKVHRRPLECHFWVLECWKTQKSQFPKIIIFLKNIQRGDPWKNKILSFLFNTEFYYGISKETIRMPFRGLAMLKSTKLITKGGLCYGFAMVAGILLLWLFSVYRLYRVWAVKLNFSAPGVNNFYSTSLFVGMFWFCLKQYDLTMANP